MGKQQLSDEVVAALVDDIRYLRGTATEMAAHLRSQAVNGVLEVATLAITSDGNLTRTYNTAVGSVVVVNANATAVTVASGGPTGTVAPTSGRGVMTVPANSWLAVPIGAHQFTVYGTAGQLVGLQVFTGMQAFGFPR
jgi:hypothetical protein